MGGLPRLSTSGHVWPETDNPVLERPVNLLVSGRLRLITFGPLRALIDS
jgi:hypothetical protein